MNTMNAHMHALIHAYRNIYGEKNPIIWRMRKQSIAGLLSKAGEGG